MKSIDKQLEMRFETGRLGLSVRRIWEHTQFRQINPFAVITAASAARPEQYVDVIDLSGPEVALTGQSLATVATTGCREPLSRSAVRRLLRHANCQTVRQWLSLLAQHLQEYSEQETIGKYPEPFLDEHSSSPLHVAGLHCALATWLEAHSAEKASGQQWLERIRNLARVGLRMEEMNLCAVESYLDGQSEIIIDGATVRFLLQHQALALSIIPVVSTVTREVDFCPVQADAAVTRTKPKLAGHEVTQPKWHDRALGYWLDKVEWNDLLGHQRRWMVFTRAGEPVVSPDEPTGLCVSYRQASKLAAKHARKFHTRLETKGMWRSYRLSGGKRYREWLVTLPHYEHSFYSSHFPLRNVLLHVRCDIWERADGSNVLVLQEVQSDWAQQARSQGSADTADSEKIPTPPWLQEWPALALKLMLLHAAQLGVSALAWTPGSVQVERYESLGGTGLRWLYDRTLPAAATRILRPYGKQCERIAFFQPAGFTVEPAIIGFKVFDEAGRLLGKVARLREARQLLPEDAHETLVTMHGVNLDAELRQALINDGFYAWGSGIK